jgi:coenzyme Q-binding protein COQ10
MPKYSIARDMRFPTAEVFAVAADVDAYKEFLPLVSDSRTYERAKDRDSRESFKGEIKVRYKKLNIDQTITSKVNLDPIKKTITAVGIAGPFEHLNSEWIFRDRKAGGCSVEFKIDYKLKSRTLQLIVSGMFDMVNRKILNAFEQRAEELYGVKRARSA